MKNCLNKMIYSYFTVGITTVCMIYLILFLKLWSYTQTNHWCRNGMKGKMAKNKLRRQSLSAPNWSEYLAIYEELVRLLKVYGIYYQTKFLALFRPNECSFHPHYVFQIMFV